MSNFKAVNQTNNYYYFFNWGYFYYGAGALSYKKIVEKFAGESATGIMYKCI